MLVADALRRFHLHHPNSSSLPQIVVLAGANCHRQVERPFSYSILVPAGQLVRACTWVGVVASTASRETIRRHRN